MMGAFGAIQRFSAIYSNHNDYSFTKIILISSFGLFSLISILYILLSSISKLVGKELRSGYSSENVFSKYPIYSHSLLVILAISMSALAHQFKISPPFYFPYHVVDNIWRYLFLINFLVIIAYYFHRLVSQSDGYYHINRHINNFIMRIKQRLGLRKLLNGIILVFVTISILLLYNVFK